jgi:hypothetical protein
MNICSQIHLMFVHKGLKQGSHIVFSASEYIVIFRHIRCSYQREMIFCKCWVFFCVGVGLTTNQFPIEEKSYQMSTDLQTRKIGGVRAVWSVNIVDGDV